MTKTVLNLRNCNNCKHASPPDTVPDGGISGGHFLCEIASRQESENIAVRPETAVNCQDFESDLCAEVELADNTQKIIKALVEAESKLDGLNAQSKLWSNLPLFKRPQTGLLFVTYARQHLASFLRELEDTYGV